MYQISDQSAPLENLRVDVEARVAECAPEMRTAARAACEARNDAIDLLRGTGRFADAWLQIAMLADGTPAPYDPGPAAPGLDAICIEIRSVQSPYSPLDAAMVQDRVMRIASGDQAHPVAVNWRVLHRACYPFVDAPPEWADLAALIPDPV